MTTAPVEHKQGVRRVVCRFKIGSRVARLESSQGVEMTLSLDPRPTKTQGMLLKLTH